VPGRHGTAVRSRKDVGCRRARSPSSPPDGASIIARALTAYKAARRRTGEGDGGTLRRVSGVTIDDIDALVGPATPHFALQLRARVRELVEDLPEDDPVRRYGEQQMELLERLGYASSKAEEGAREPRTRPGWEEIPSSAPVDEPLLPKP
jgi:hypothetical protein